MKGEILHKRRSTIELTAAIRKMQMTFPELVMKNDGMESLTAVEPNERKRRRSKNEILYMLVVIQHSGIKWHNP